MKDSRAKYLLAALGAAAIWGIFAIPLRNLKLFFPEEILYYRIFSSFFFIWIIILFFRKMALKDDVIYIKSLPEKQKVSLLAQLVLTSLLLLAN